MPEGDTIYRAARALQKALGGRVVTAFETGFAKLAAVNDDSPVVGRVVERVEARGKWCLIFFSGDLILVSHMLMSGSWHIYRTGEKWFMPKSKMRVMIRVSPNEPQGLKPHAHQASNGTTEVVPLTEPGGGSGTVEVVPLTRAVDSTQSAGGFEAVLFNAQIAEFHTARSLERSSQVPKLGPDVLGGGFSLEAGVAALRARAASHPEDEVGVVLLNQRVLAGLGNVYKSEVAFAARVNPWRRMKTLSEAEMRLMVEFSERYMKANVAEAGGPSGEGGEGIVTYTGARRTTRSMQESDRVWVYRRSGQECRRCGTAVLMRKQGLDARSTYWCPVCQP